MKKIVVFTVLLLFSLGLKAEDINIDSLRNILAHEQNKSTKLQCINQLFYYYVYVYPDSAFKYAQQFLLTALDTKSDSAVAEAYSAWGEFYDIIGNYPQSLQSFYKSLQVAEKTKSFLLIGRAYNHLGAIYEEQGDLKKSIELGKLAKNIYDKNWTLAYKPSYISDTGVYYFNIINALASAYQENNQLDSAMQYTQYLERIANVVLGSLNAPIAFNYGNIYLKKKDYARSADYYRLGMYLAKRDNVNVDILSNAYGLANTFHEIKRFDSAIFYANQVLEMNKVAKFSLIQMHTVKLLANTYKEQRNADSAAKYFELAMTMQDSLFNRDKNIQIQNLTFTEQVRQRELEEEERKREYLYRIYGLVFILVIVGVIAFLLYRNNRSRQRAYVILQKQKEEIDFQKSKTEQALEELKSTQSQLIQSEKMASLGELTAGIAHEIQNPLNFVNNFSEVNNELIDEMNDENDINEIKAIANHIRQNNEKISFHGKRADAIVKGMLQHSGKSEGKKELTDINALCDEYLRLSYHGLRAKDKSFNADFKTDFDESIGNINIIPQDIGRVLLNLFNNAFYAVSAKSKDLPDMEGYKPGVSVSTKKINDKIEIKVKDNGNGIPQKVVDKIFQPFFTTKPTGEGTGLGLSLSYDIVKAHGGEIKVEATSAGQGEGTEFIIQLPVKDIE